MRFKILGYTISIFVITLIQSTVLDYIKIFNIKPNLLLVFVVAVALLRGNVEGAVIGFLAGLSHDIVSGKLLGFYSLLGLYVGLIIGSVNKRLYRENILLAVFFTFITSIIYEYVVYFFTLFMKGNADLIFPIRNIILPEAVYNSVASIFIFILVVKLNYAFESTGKVTRKY